MSTNPLNDISKVYLEQVAAVEEGVRPTPVDKPLDKASFKKRRRSLVGKEKSAEARKRGHEGKEWYNSGRTYSPDEAKRMRSKLDDEERSTRHRSSVDPEGDDSNYSADKTKNPKKIRKQKAMGELGESIKNPESRAKLRSIMDKEVRKGDKSKGENPRSKYPTERGKQASHLLLGRDETGSNGNPVRSRGGTNAPADERVGKGPHRAGNAAYWASVAGPTRDRGAGSAAARRAAALKKEDFEMDESAVPGKPAERLGAVTAIPKSEQEAARQRTLAKAAAIRAKKGIKTEALDPVGHEDADVDNDGKKGTNADKYLLKRRKAIGKAISTQEAKEVKRWWDDDGDGKGYEEGEVSGKFNRKKKVKEAKVYDPMEDPDFDPHEAEKNRGVSGKNNPKGGKPVKMKEGYSNWREDLIEVVDKIKKDKSEDVKITEKQVNNKIDINPKLDLGEAVENLGGTLLEMVEVDEVDYIVESVYDELLDEGYEEDDIEEALEYALTEAKVTFGHDTPTGQKKKGNLLKAVGRLARQKLSSKVRGAKTAAKQAVARGARKVAKGALGVARKVEGGDKKPHTAARKPSTYRGAGAGQKEKVSSGSYQAPTKKKAEKPADPWEGSATTPAKAATKKAAAPKAKAPAATKRKRKSKLDDLLASVRSESIEINEMPYQVMGSPDGGKEKKIGKPVKSRKYADARAAELADTHKATGGKYRSQYVEEVQIDEKTLTATETKEKERLVKSMKSKASDFEKRYPGRGKEVMYATATKIAKKIAEQAMELQPKTQPEPKSDQQQKKTQQQQDRMRQQEVQILQRKLQALRSAPKGVNPSITA